MEINGIRSAAASDDAIQIELDAMMEIFEEYQDKLPEGAYLRGMNALGSLHRHKRTTLAARRPGDILRCWQTLDEIMDENEDLYDEIMEVADNIMIELCGDDATIYTNHNENLVARGEEKELFEALVNYKPVEGNAGYETSPMVLHHALQLIMARLFDDTYHELEIVRPVSCQCGWRGSQGNWDRHITNMRHVRWVLSQRRMIDARESIVVRRESGIVYIKSLSSHLSGSEFEIATKEAIHAAEMAGDRVIFVCADGTMSWFA
jgi:hypothetical protein